MTEEEKTAWRERMERRDEWLSEIYEVCPWLATAVLGAFPAAVLFLESRARFLCSWVVAAMHVPYWLLGPLYWPFISPCSYPRL